MEVCDIFIVPSQFSEVELSRTEINFELYGRHGHAVNFCFDGGKLYDAPLSIRGGTDDQRLLPILCAHITDKRKRTHRYESRLNNFI